MGKIHTVRRFCDDCGEWRDVRAAQRVERNPNVKCRRHSQKKGKIGNRVKHPTGYVVVRTADGYRYEHRVIWEQHHGPIPAGYHVHHINHVRNDNRIENLELVLGRRHNRDHTQERHDERTLDNRGAKSGRWLTDLDNDEIVRRHDAGESYAKIAATMGTTAPTVRTHYLRAKEGLA